MLLRTLLALLISTTGALAQLNWGVNGAGGTGTWDTTTQNWYDGTNNVQWDSNIAIFGGSQGNITISGTVSANQLTFNTAGDNILSGTLSGPTSGTLSIITNASAAINATITTNFEGSGAVLLKDGTGTLTIGSLVENFAAIQINNGDLDLGQEANIAFASVNLSNVAGASLSFMSGVSIQGLNGGGSSGGNIMPDADAAPSVVTFASGGIGSYAGSLQDNGATALIVQALNNSNQTLTGVNTYSGATQISGGTIIFSGGGSATHTASISVTNGGTLMLDNTAVAVSDRLAGSATMNLQGGSFIYLGNSATPTAESTGALTVGAGSFSKITIMPDPAQSSSVTFASLGQTNSSNLGGLLFRGPNLGATPGAGTANIYFTTAPTLTGGGGGAGSTTQSIVPYALGDNSPTGNGTSFVTYGPNGIRPLADNEYADDSFAVATANVNIDAPNTLGTSAAVNALRLQDGGSISGSGTLTATSGAVLGLPGTTSISTAQLAFGANPIIFQIEGTTTIGSTITGTNSTAGFQKFGNGELILTGPNSYAGPTRITAGVLNIQNATALGSTSGATTVLGGAVLQIQGGISVGTEALTVNGFGGAELGTTGALRSISGANSWAGNITLNQASIGVDSGSLTLGGTLTLTGLTSGLTKVGNGTLNVTNAIPTSSTGIVVAGGWLISNATSGNALGTSVSLIDGNLGFAPSGTGGVPSLNLNTDTFSFTGGAALQLNKAGNNSLTVDIPEGFTRASGSTLLIIPTGGVAALGNTEVLQTVDGGLTGGVASGALVAQNNDANSSGDFVSNNSGSLKVATYSTATNLNTAGDVLFQANSDQTLGASVAIVGLKDNGHTIDLGTHQLQVTNGLGQSGIILNGGTIQNGQLAFLTTEGIIYTNLTGGTISAQVTGTAGLTTFGPGTLTLSGSNSYTGTTSVNGGNLNLTGSIASAVNLTPGAILSGTGKTTSTIGGGLISPGSNQVGILTASQAKNEIDTGSVLRASTNFAFEFDQTGLPNFSSATASGNDLLHLTSHTAPFSSALTSNNQIDLYFNVPFGLQAGQTYMGGFYSDAGVAFDSSILGATYDVFVSDPAGTTTFDGNNYDILPSDPIIVSTVPETANFGSGPVNGYIMEVQVTPEPASCLALASGAAILGLLRPARRRR